MQVDYITRTDPPQVVTLGQLTVAFNHGLWTLPPAAETPALPPLDTELVTILAADVLQLPVRVVDVVSRVGRFALVEYHPVFTEDPDVIIYTGIGGHRFHAAMLRFQQARHRDFVNLRHWYARTKQAARGLILPLSLLDATPHEAEFVLRWALECCAQYKTT